MEKVPFPGEGFLIENRRLGSLFEDRRIRQKKTFKKKNQKKPIKKTRKKPKNLEFWEQKFEIPSIQADMCLYRDYPMQAQSRYRHTFSVSQVCACIGYLLYLNKTFKTQP